MTALYRYNIVEVSFIEPSGQTGIALACGGSKTKPLDRTPSPDPFFVQKTATAARRPATSKRTASVGKCGTTHWITTRTNPRACLLWLILSQLMQLYWNNCSMLRNLSIRPFFDAPQRILTPYCSVEFYYSGPEPPALVLARTHVYPAPRYLKLCYLAHRKAGTRNLVSFSCHHTCTETTPQVFCKTSWILQS